MVKQVETIRVQDGSKVQINLPKGKGTYPRQKKIKIHHFPMMKKGRPIRNDKQKDQGKNMKNKYEKKVKQVPQNLQTQKENKIQLKNIFQVEENIFYEVSQANFLFTYQFPCYTFSANQREKMIKQQGSPIKELNPQFSFQIQSQKINKVFDNFEFENNWMQYMIKNIMCLRMSCFFDVQVTGQYYKLIRLTCDYLKKQKQRIRIENQSQSKYFQKDKNSAFNIFVQKIDLLEMKDGLADVLSTQIAKIVKERTGQFIFYNYHFTKINLSRKLKRYELFTRHKNLIMSLLKILQTYSRDSLVNAYNGKNKTQQEKLEISYGNKQELNQSSMLNSIQNDNKMVDQSQQNNLSFDKSVQKNEKQRQELIFEEDQQQKSSNQESTVNANTKTHITQIQGN